MVTYIPCDSWDRVYLLIKQGLRQANYPNLARGPGGTANICCIVGWYQKGTPSQNDNVADQFTKLEQDGDLIRFTIVTRNEGDGGQHSEPRALELVQHRALAQGKDVYLFTERAPCAIRCQSSLSRWSETFERDIIVQYRTPYTDTDTLLLDPIMKTMRPATAQDARSAVKAMRENFSLV